MKATTVLTASLLAAGIAAAVHAANAPLRPNQLETRIVRGEAQALTLPSRAAPSAVVATYLRGQGRSEATLRSLKVKSEARSLRNNGVRHVRMGQEVGGLPVYDTYVKAAIGRNGELLSLVENLAPVPAKGVARAAIDERAALSAAMHALKIPAAVPGVALRDGNQTRFARGSGFAEGPLVTRVAVPMSDGSMQAGFLVQTWRLSGNRLVETLVDGNGRIIETVSRTNSDSYNIFPVSPDLTPQQVVSGQPGWLFPGNHRSIDIAGNNVHAYLDAVNDSVPDPGGTTISDGNFLSAFDPDVQPSTSTNRNVAVQNLFYLNNVIHDRLYQAGFTEAAGNFQEDNFGLGGRGSDSVRAEAQDGGGTDNANFATPRDGQNPRMQMYLWTSSNPDHEVVVTSGAVGPFDAVHAAWGPALTTTGITGEAVLVDDGVAGAGTPPGTVNDGCESFGGVSGKIAVVDRGFCGFAVKAQNAQAAGAIGLIVVNNAPGGPIVMGGTPTTTITIPPLMIGLEDRAAFTGVLPTSVTLRLKDPPPIQIDGDLDSDIVWHEYGHGLTWRMIGRMSGPLAGAIGEGMSDTLAIIVNDDPEVAEYSASSPLGIRRASYDGYPLTYGDVTGTGVHNDGEIYAATTWRLWKSFEQAGYSADQVLSLLVDGMNYTPAQPTYEEMRDGILAATSSPAEQCMVWTAFAESGIGVGAKGRVRGSKVLITESFAVPPACE